MADRTDFYFRQRVTEAELDLAFELLEKADHDLVADLGVHGIISGAVPVPHEPLADLTIDLVEPTRAYDAEGRRVFIAADQNVDCSMDYAGIPTEVATSGEERRVGVFLAFDRQLSDPRTDGNSQEVMFRRDESYKIVVRQGPTGPVGEAPMVPLQDNELLVCEVIRRHGQTQILEGDIDTARRQVFVFAHADAVGVISGLWNILKPETNTVQSALDEVDAELNSHFQGLTGRHSATDIDCLPTDYLESTNLQSALTELLADLSSADSGSAGSSRIGADAVPGTPLALPAATVDTQLSGLLGFLNDHVGKPSGAHAASAISAQSYEHIAGASVQAQLQEIVQALKSQDASLGAELVGNAAIGGNPNGLVAGSVRQQLAALLADLNNHQKDTIAAHDASAVFVEDEPGNFSGNNVEAVLKEIIEGFGLEHIWGNESPGHKTIHQPAISSGRVLLWDAEGVPNTLAHLRVYADVNDIWFVLNAKWDETGWWVKDKTEYYAAGFRLSRNEFELLHQGSTDVNMFQDWQTTWRLAMSAETNSAFEARGTVREDGRVALGGSNPTADEKTISMAGAVTFRSRFGTTPSSITLSIDYKSNDWESVPAVTEWDRDGFVYHSNQRIGGYEEAWWYGKYTAIA